MVSSADILVWREMEDVKQQRNNLDIDRMGGLNERNTLLLWYINIYNFILCYGVQLRRYVER